jgi:hypothetical protein
VSRVLRRAGGAAVAGFLSVAVLTGTSGSTAHAASTTSPAPAIVLRGEGAWSAYELNTGWHNDLATAKTPIDLRYTAVGSYFGRADFLKNGADWAISGVPFTDAELAQAKIKRSDLVDAPLLVSSLGMMFEVPEGGSTRPGFNELEQRCDPFDESTWPPDITTLDQALNGCLVWKPPYTGQIKVPWTNLAAMLFTETRDAHGGTTGEPLDSWNEPGVLAAFGVSNLLSIPLGTGPSTVLRSDPDETMYYLQQFAERFTPKVWDLLKQDNPQATWDPITERLPRNFSLTRGQADQQADLVKWPPSDPASGQAPAGGVLAPIPASIIVEPRNTWQITNAPADFVKFLPVQNDNGDWVQPTTASLTKAAAAGLESPLYAFAHKVPGAYPFTWIDHLYAPAHGLSIDKTNALATLMRYLATAGQAVAAKAGEGTLPPPLVAQSLAAANALVASNCVGNDRVVVQQSDPGSFAPTSPTLTGLGSVSLCDQKRPTPPTSAAPAAAGQPVVTTSPGSSFATGTYVSNPEASSAVAASSSASASTASSTGSSASQPATATKTEVGAKKKRTLLVASGLPIQLPGSSSTDKLGAFLLGALLFLVLRKPIANTWQRIMT